MNSFEAVLEKDFEEVLASNPLPFKELSHKHLFVSGAYGFLPSYFVKFLFFLQEKGVVQNLKLTLLGRSKTRFQEVYGNALQKFEVNVLYQSVTDPLPPLEVDWIIHAASPASPKWYTIDPMNTFKSNVLGTLQLLEKIKTKKFLLVSSAEIYGSQLSNAPISETPLAGREGAMVLDPLSFRAAYAEGKRAAETAAYCFAKTNGITLHIIRPFHIYGPGLQLDDGRVYADFVDGILNKKEIRIESAGSAVRSFCYLQDALTAFFAICLFGNEGEAYNIGNDQEIYSIKELAHVLANEFPGTTVDVRGMPAISGNESVSRVVPSLEKLRKLGWSPHVNVKEGFRRTLMSFHKSG